MSARFKVCRYLCGAALVLLSQQAIAAGDVTRGARLFGQCATCHSTRPGEHLTGPSLAGVWDRKAGSVASFLRYSDALKAADVTWNASTLDRWLADPKGFIPGNDMAFAGIKNASARQDVIAYLEAVSRGEAPKAGERRGGMMMGRAQRADLRKAGPDSVVASLTHCRDTYIAKTVNGDTHKIWEFNLRLKSDSSEYGPSPGKPVITGSGMMGDRASIVFAKPSEISRFVKESCE